MRVFAVTTVVGLGVVLGACGADRTGGPTGAPATVVVRAPAVTLAAGRAAVTGAAKAVVTKGSIDLDTGEADLTTEGEGRPGPFLVDPVLVLDLVAGAVNIETYGGVQVQEASAFRYQVDIDPDRALAAAPPNRRPRLAAALPDRPFFADVFIDGAGRIRRVLLPIDLTEPRPMGRDKRVPDMLTVDFHDFPEEA